MPRHPHRILICDDDDDVRMHLELVLSTLGFRIAAVASGTEAVALLGREHHDLLLLDIMMRGISGIETLRRLKLDPLTARIPVVMLTALDEKETRDACHELGAAGFLAKPVTEHDLLGMILKVLLDWEQPKNVRG